ncbi:MAG: ribosomal protein S18-alanine N-acetyltransferase [Dehalococcoidia bacterium]
MPEVAYLLRPIEDEDIPQVTEIDREAFPGESLFRPYTSYKQEIHNSLAHYTVACIEKGTEPKPSREDMQKKSWLKRLLGQHHLAISTSAVRNNLYIKEYIVGFAGFWAMLNEAHIIAIAVRNNYRRKGIGEGLLISVIEVATQLHANVITLEVRASNVVARALYKKYGFRVVGRRPRYYSDNGEDAVLMSTDTITLAPFQAHFQRLKEAHSQRWGKIFTTQLA